MVCAIVGQQDAEAVADDDARRKHEEVVDVVRVVAIFAAVDSKPPFSRTFTLLRDIERALSLDEMGATVQ